MKTLSIRSSSTKRSARKRIKVFLYLPHADDETFIGGLISRAKKEIEGIRFMAFLMTSGFLDKLKEIRRAEFIRSCELFGIEPIFLEFPLTKKVLVRDFDSGESREVALLDANSNFVEIIASTLIQENPDALILPHKTDGHPDHNTTARVVNGALCYLMEHIKDFRITLLQYQVWQPLLSSPNLYIGFDEGIFSFKSRAISFHRSQLPEKSKEKIASNRFDVMMKSLACYSAVVGPEKIFGPSSKGVMDPYAELYEATTICPWYERKKEPAFFTSKTPLNEDIFIP